MDAAIDKIDKIEIRLIKKIEKIVMEDADKYKKAFASELVNTGFNVQESHGRAYKTVNKIRASTLLQDTGVWKQYFALLPNKHQKSKQEEMYIKAYNEFKEDFRMSPFDMWIYYVQYNEEIKGAVINIISPDCVKNIWVLGYLYKFFKTINRSYFYEKVRARIIEEIKEVELTRKNYPEKYTNFESTLRLLRKEGILINEIINNEQ